MILWVWSLEWVWLGWFISISPGWDWNTHFQDGTFLSCLVDLVLVFFFFFFHPAVLEPSLCNIYSLGASELGLLIAWWSQDSHISFHGWGLPREMEAEASRPVKTLLLYSIGQSSQKVWPLHWGRTWGLESIIGAIVGKYSLLWSPLRKILSSVAGI